ncbi:calcium-binding protein [Actinoplanes sichuanensis]|uniref:Calcium-binding protein n=1 Tax=Actinoplanes sichuanensis TaxID=512349 RepID=A0ABW4A5I9_9ACTN|nr:calcium-binding protein [Actinoplanes sichuanensis]
MIGATAVAVATSSLFLANPAQAAGAGLAKVVGTNKVQFQALVGKSNSLTITISGRTVTLDDKVAIKAGKGCKAVKGDKTKVKCTTSKKTAQITAALGDKNDYINNKTSVFLLVFGGSGNDTLVGGPGRDQLQGSYGVDKLYGNGGNDTLFGESDGDYLYGGYGNDYADGGYGLDRVWGQAGNDTIFGDSGYDVLSGGDGVDKIDGETGNDTIYGDNGNDQLEGGAGNDTISGAAGADLIDGGADNDTIYAGSGQYVGSDNQTYGDESYGGAGNDTIYGQGDYDYINGEDGVDTVSGGAGRDWVEGGFGNDRVYGSENDDVVIGEFTDKNWELVEDPNAVDYADGGTNDALGDVCVVTALSTAVNCEPQSGTAGAKAAGRTAVPVPAGAFGDVVKNAKARR